MKMICCRRPLIALHALILLRHVRHALSQCDLCAATGGAATFKVKPGTGCVEYVQCVDGENIGDFTCSGDTIYDEEKQYCNWRTEVTCLESIQTCPPSKKPSTDAPTPSAIDCPNSCPVGANGFYTVPGSRCKEYVQCEDGMPVEELECFGDTLFNQNAGYCDWPYNYSCGPIECPERNPTESSESPTIPSVEIQISVPDVDVVIESADCPNPCPGGYTGFQVRPGTQCKKYVQCEKGIVMAEMECTGELAFNTFGQYCDWAVTCGETSCPEPTPSPAASITIVVPENPEPTPSPAAPATIVLPETPDVTIPVTVGTGNLCRLTYSGLRPKPGTNCKIYVQCEDGEVVGEFSCSGDNVFVEETGVCEIREDWICPDFQTYSPSITQQPSGITPIPTDNSITLIVGNPLTAPPTIPPTPRPIRTPRPTTRMPTPMPSSTYQYFRTYLGEREELLKSVVFQSNGSPSTEYTYPDFLSSLEVAAFQLPADKAFFIGEGVSGRLPKLSGLEYGLVNLAAFFSNAMEEGLRIDSCDEWNSDFMYDGLREKYPLSNACGQYARQYEDEDCAEMEPFQCSLNKTMEVTAVHSNAESKAPPFTCQARIVEDGTEIFPGYYDSVDDVVIQSAYANTLGRTDLENCCWWGRGVMLTRGRCSIGKMDKYLGQGAVDRGIFVYPDVNFCSDPEVICNHERSREFRWVLGLLEWSDRVQSYVDSNTGWNYLDELKRFVDGGMDNDDFINAVINIFTRNCHNDGCLDQWQLDDANNLFESNRRDHFRRIIFEVWNLPMTYHPTENPTLPPTWQPTHSPSDTVIQHPTVNPTNKPTRRNKGNQTLKVIGLPPNSAQPWSIWDQSKWLTLALAIQFLFL